MEKQKKPNTFHEILYILKNKCISKNNIVLCLTRIVSISFGQSMSISLTHIKQTSLRSGGTKELHNVKSRVAISPISFQRAKICLQSVPLPELLALLLVDLGPTVLVASEVELGCKDIEDEVEVPASEEPSEPLLREDETLRCWIFGDFISSEKMFRRSISCN